MTLRRRGYCEGWQHEMSVVLRGCLLLEKTEKESSLQKFKEKHGIQDRGIGLGYSDKEKKWYGYSHRAIFGFGVGDRVFEPSHGNEKTNFKRHGSRSIRNMRDAEKSAKSFSRYVS